MGEPVWRQTYREKMLNEVQIGAKRIHFMGRLPYNTYSHVLQISSAHVYLTGPLYYLGPFRGNGS